MNSNAISKELKYFENSLKLRAYRHQLIASNVANADTPNYKARDIDFKKAMSNAMTNSKPNSLGVNRTNNRHLEGRPVNPLEQRYEYRRNVQPSIDGNTVEIDSETANATDNSVHYNAAFTILNDQIKGMRSAISGQ